VNRFRRWAWPLVLIGGLLGFYAVREATVATGNPNFVPALILLGAAVMPGTFVAFIGGRRLVFGVGGGTIALTALVGGVIGVVTAGVLEYDAQQDLGVLPTAGIGLIEETAKLIVPALLVFVLRPRLPGDGLLIGVASGAGFAVLETMGYAFVELIQSRGSIAAVDDVLFVRGVLSPAAHMAWTGLTAAAMWAVARPGRRSRALAGFAAAFLVAVALHTAWDTFGNPWAYGILAVLSLGILGVAVHRAAVASRPLLPAPGRREAVSRAGAAG
jgi:protease PrsW